MFIIFSSLLNGVMEPLSSLEAIYGLKPLITLVAGDDHHLAEVSTVPPQKHAFKHQPPES